MHIKWSRLVSCDKVDKSKIEQQTCYEANKGAFINDVMQFWPRITPPLPPSLTLKWVFYLHLHKECHKITIPLLAWRHLWTPPKTHLSDCFFYEIFNAHCCLQPNKMKLSTIWCIKTGFDCKTSIKENYKHTCSKSKTCFVSTAVSVKTNSFIIAMS